MVIRENCVSLEPIYPITYKLSWQEAKVIWQRLLWNLNVGQVTATPCHLLSLYMQAKFEVSNFSSSWDMGCIRSRQNFPQLPFPSRWRAQDPRLTQCSTVFTPNSILIRSATFAQRSRVEPRDRQTHWQTLQSLATTVCILCIQYGLIIFIAQKQRSYFQQAVKQLGATSDILIRISSQLR